MALALAPREQAVTYGAPPRADLLPPAEKERRALGALKRRWIVAVLAVLVAAVLVVLVAVALRVQAGMGVGAEEDRRAELQGKLAEFSDVTALVTERNGLATRRTEAMVADMNWSKPYERLVAVLPAGAHLTGFTAATGGQATGDPAALGVKGVATVTSGRPIDQALVLDSFATVENVIGVDMLGLEKTEIGYSYRIYVAFDQGIYNKRFQADASEQATQEVGK